MYSFLNYILLEKLLERASWNALEAHLFFIRMQGGRAAGGVGGWRLLLDLPPGHGVGAGLGGGPKEAAWSPRGETESVMQISQSSSFFGPWGSTESVC